MDQPSDWPKSNEERKLKLYFRDISIWIDNYDDIFSDFDPRPYSERNISDDFLFEVRKVSIESDFRIKELKLLVPTSLRNNETEKIIIERLQSYFKKNLFHFERKVKNEKKRGLLFTLAGMSIMILASYFSYLKWDSFIKHVLVVLLEPAGWFMVWTGLDHFVFSPRERKPELEFHKKLSNCNIIFISI